MPEPIVDDVLETPSTPPETGTEVETKPDEGNDKEKNFAELRKRLEEAEAERVELRKKLAEKENPDRSLSIETPDETKPSKKDDETLKRIFERDMKEATIQWSQSNKTTAEEWAQIKTKVTLKGDETLSEIKAKIDEAYHSLPTVRERREKELLEKGKRLAMQQFNDEELDMGGGGGDVNLGGDVAPRLNPKTKSWAKGLGLGDKDLKDVDFDSDPNQWSEGQSAKRSFFQG
jgi:hypothetical protein